ncbi:MAG: hypothetical protein Q7U10_08810 [Thermodesulfovibrionia bacterium]|nr:hypothetical protein [Thermodesulfovibrionia bacterium]
MAKINLTDGDKNKWFQYDIDTEVCLRLMSKAELRAINKQAKKNSGLTSADQDEIADKKLGREAVIGWRKMADHNHPGFILNGEPLSFTPINIDLLMTKSFKFSKFVNEMCVSEDEFIEEPINPKND